MERNTSYYLNLNISFKCMSANFFVCLLHVTKSTVYPWSSHFPLEMPLSSPHCRKCWCQVYLKRTRIEGSDHADNRDNLLNLSLTWEKSAPSYAQHGIEQSCVQGSLVMPTSQEASLSSSLQESLLPLSMTLPLPHKLTDEEYKRQKVETTRLPKSWNCLYMIAKQVFSNPC